MKPRAFVAMPFGVKKNGQGNKFDFNCIYVELIRPAMEVVKLLGTIIGSTKKFYELYTG